VGDPEGPWGLGVVRAKDLAALLAFQAGDPVIRAGRGFRYVNLPMINAVYSGAACNRDAQIARPDRFPRRARRVRSQRSERIFPTSGGTRPSSVAR
jgi:hypothetical protein